MYRQLRFHFEQRCSGASSGYFLSPVKRRGWRATFVFLRLSGQFAESLPVLWVNWSVQARSIVGEERENTPSLFLLGAATEKKRVEGSVVFLRLHDSLQSLPVLCVNWDIQAPCIVVGEREREGEEWEKILHLSFSWPLYRGQFNVPFLASSWGRT